jgi:glyoxylase-like metal-dependent hydrolase (beta-lactamase superfamily II)
MTRAFQAEINRHTDKPVRQLINTHHHVDYTLGNEHFTGLDIVGHVRCHEEMLRFAGGVAFHYVTPLAFGGHIGGWIRVIDAIEKVDVETIVPGHGPVGDKSYLHGLSDYFALLRRVARRGFNEGAPVEEVVRRVKLGRFSQWGEAERIIPN